MLARDIIRIFAAVSSGKVMAKTKKLARVLNWLHVLRESKVLRFNFTAAKRRSG